MKVLERVEEIRSNEHLRLRLSLASAGEALEALGVAQRSKIEEARALVRKTDLFGNPLPDEPMPVLDRRVDYSGVAEAWPQIEAAVLDRLDRWEEVLWPLVKRWADGEAVEAEVRDEARRWGDSRQFQGGLLDVLRDEVRFLSGLNEVKTLFAAADSAERSEDEVIPVLLSGSRTDAEQVGRRQTPQDVTRNLRAALTAPREPEKPKKPKDPLQRLLGWVGVGRD